MLGYVLDRTLRMLHPVIPFVTEELWTTLTGRESIVIADWPAPDPALHDEAAEAEIRALQAAVTEVRRFRAEQGLAPSQRVPARLRLGADIAAHEEQIRTLTRFDAPAVGFRATTRLATPGATVELDLSGAIDVEAERRRLAKDLAAAEKERTAGTAELGNPGFLGKAPAHVVEKIRTGVAGAEADIERINAQLATLEAVSAG